MNEIIRLLKRDWLYFVVITAIFVASVLFGRKLPELAPDAARALEKQTMAHFAEIARLMQGAPWTTQVMVIWMNNLIASVTAVIIGALLIPLLPLVLVVGNGLVVGLVQRFSETQGFEAARFYLALLPHGIFELPAFFIAVYLGARFSLIPYRLIWHYAKSKQYRPFLKEYLHDLRYYSILFVVLLLLAAIIEVTVSPMLLR